MTVIRAKVLGLCMGVRKATQAVEAALLKKTGQVFTYGPLIHNNTALEDFKKRGVRILHEDDITFGKEAAVIIRAHGVPPEIKKKLISAHFTVIDATCPRVLSSQKQAATYSAKGYTVIIAGDKNHGEVVGISGCVSGTSIVIENTDDANNIEYVPQKSVLIAQTTITQEEYAAIAKLLLKKNNHLKVLQTICPATQERQNALQKLCAKVDGILVIGGKNSANTARLYKTAQKLCAHAALIEDTTEIPPEFFNLKTVGLTAGASTPDAVIDEVEKVLTERIV